MGTLCLSVTNPIDVIKIRMQIDNELSTSEGSHVFRNRTYKGFIRGSVKIVQDEGIRGLYKGCVTTLQYFSIAFLSNSCTDEVEIYLRVHVWCVGPLAPVQIILPPSQEKKSIYSTILLLWYCWNTSKVSIYPNYRYFQFKFILFGNCIDIKIVSW